MCEWEGAEGGAGRRCVWERSCAWASQVWICARKTQLLAPSFYFICVFLCVFERVQHPFGAKAPGQRSWWSHLFIVCHSRLPPTCCFHCVSSLLFFNSSAHIFSIFSPLSFSHMLLTASTPSPLLLLVPLSAFYISICHKHLRFPWRKKDNYMYILVIRVVVRYRCNFFIVVSCNDHALYWFAGLCFINFI